MRYRISVLFVLAILLLTGVSFLVPSLKTRSSENRTMATFDMVFAPRKDSVVYRDSPAERFDLALSDQFPCREFWIKNHARLFDFLENTIRRSAKAFMPKKSGAMLHAVGGCEMIGDTGYLTRYPRTAPLNRKLLRKHVKQIEYLHTKFPDLKFYVYYISQAYDAPWIEAYTGIRPADRYREIADLLPDYVKSGRLVYRDLRDYMNLHYKTDHHWNHRGARRGYEDIFAMMSPDLEMGKLRLPESENPVSRSYDFGYLGSYGRILGELYKGGYDEFSFYEYRLPRRKTAILDLNSRKEIPAVEMGLYDEYRAGRINRDIGEDHYTTLYGTARDVNGRRVAETGLYIIRSSGGNGKNLLLCGDSFNRAIRDVLASHFDTTVYFDYRLFAEIPVDAVIERYKIDVLLISSHLSMWGVDRYFFTFGRER